MHCSELISPAYDKTFIILTIFYRYTCPENEANKNITLEKYREDVVIHEYICRLLASEKYKWSCVIHEYISWFLSPSKKYE